MERVTNITLDLYGVEMTDANKSIVEQLFSGCTKLETLILSYGNLNDVDFSGLNGRDSLTALYLVRCQMTKVPKLQLRNIYLLMVHVIILLQGTCRI